MRASASVEECERILGDRADGLRGGGPVPGLGLVRIRLRVGGGVGSGTGTGQRKRTPSTLTASANSSRPRVLSDEAFGELLTTFTTSGGRRLRLLWPVSRTWYRVRLERRTPASPVIGPSTVIHETPTELPYGLSPRELDLLTLAAVGHTDQAIAQHLYLSPRTVHSDVEHLLRKTGGASRAEATALALRDGLLRPIPTLVPHFTEKPRKPVLSSTSLRAHTAGSRGVRPLSFSG
jgi:DNA-binding CsgD family transcriptional regulator